MKRTLLALAFLLIFLIQSPLNAQTNYKPSEANLEARTWFQDAKFGLFIHWGVYSVMAGGGDMGIAEWIMHRKGIPVSQYEILPGFFNPIEFDPEEWVAMVKNAGMKYITITSKHHDGFAMYNSEVSDYNVVDATPYGRDILGMLKEECDRQGIKLFFYYSQLDWHHPDYFPRGRTGDKTGRPDSGEWDAYIDYMNSQLKELLTNYGEIGGIWFDGMWDKPDADWRLEETYALIHELQNQALIGSNHHKLPYSGEDFQMFERDLPGANSMGFNKAEIGVLPLEMCETMNGSWGYNIKDTDYKSTKTLLQTMIKAAGKNSNFLLNTGPMPNGKIQPANIKTLQEMGEWMRGYGESIYGTRGGPVEEQPWGVSTQKDKHVYLHVLNQDESEIMVPIDPKSIKSAKDFLSKEKIKFKRLKDGISIVVPTNEETIDYIIVLEMK